MSQLLGVGSATNLKAAGGFTIGNRLVQLKTEPSVQDIESLFLFALAWSVAATANTGALRCHF